MKKIFVIGLLLTVFSLVVPQGVFANSVVNITKEGAATASEVKVMQIAGGTFFARLYWGLAYIRVTIKTTPNTKFYRGTGELTTLSEISAGDVLDVTGELESDSTTLTFIASTIRNSSVQKKQTIASGKVVSVNLPQRSFVLNSPKLGVITVSVKPATTFIKGNRTLDLEHVTVGDTITKTAGDYDLNTKTLLADSVLTYVNPNYYKPQNFEGKLESVSSASLPTTLRVSVGQTSFLVNLNEKTTVLNKNRNSVSLNRFVAGDMIRIYGEIKEVDEAIINAEIVRNMSL